jgi:hypothetical protein
MQLKGNAGIARISATTPYIQCQNKKQRVQKAAALHEVKASKQKCKYMDNNRTETVIELTIPK